MKMPWGKHAGEEIEDLPDIYLKWLAENLDESKHHQICIAADKEYRFRKDNQILGENP